MQNRKYLNHILIWNLFFTVICIPTAGKLIDVGGIPLSISIYYFPFVYIFSDILTEVYGYAAARRVLWYSVAAQIAATLIFQFVVYYPPSAVMSNNQSFVDVLSAAPRIVVFGTMAMFIGDIVNNYVLAKMKVLTKGKHIAARFVASTLLGQVVNTGFFYAFGLWSIMPLSALFMSVMMGSLIKVIVEIVMLPITLKVARFLKQAEAIDFYDEETDFNPLKL
jgi:queuosine precursor transporter